MNRKNSTNKVQNDAKKTDRSNSNSALKNVQQTSQKAKVTSKQEQKVKEDEKIVASSRRDRSQSRNLRKVEDKKSVSKVSLPVKNVKSQKASVTKSPITQEKTKSSRMRTRNAKKQVEQKSEADDSEQNEQEESQSDQIRFKKGAFVAYFDPTADDQLHFKIAKVQKEAFNSDKELQCDIFESKNKGKLEFYQTHSNTCIFDHTIIQEIQVEVLKINLKKSKAADIYLKIKKVDIKNMENLIPSLLKALKKDSDEESQSSQEEEEEEEEDESEEYEKSQQNKSAKQKGQSQNKLKKETLKKNKKEDEDMNDEENEDKSEGQDQMQIDSSAHNTKKNKISSQIVKKRNNKKSLEEDQDEEEEGPSDQQENVQKRKKVGKSATQNEPRTIASRKKSAKPKAKKVLTEFKLGVFNPDIQIIEEEPQKESNDKQIIKPKCCVRCNNKNVHRAAFTANFDLLKNLTHDKVNISRLSAQWGPDDKITPLDILIKNGDPLLLELVLKPNIKLQRNEIYQNVLNEFYTNRAQEDPFLINFVDSGTVSRMAYGAYVRSVEMTRGSRQGNNAFLESEDQDKNLQNIVYSYDNEIPQYFKKGEMTVEKYKTLEKLKNNLAGDIFQSQSSQFIDQLIRIGEFEVSAYILKDLWALTNFGFNELHYLALCPPNTGKPLSEFKSVSVVKKAQNNKNVTPLHFACINPHPEILKQLLNINSDINIQDFEMRKPIHYAAACENSDNLQTLIDLQANLSDIDMKKVSCLHIAAQAGRAENMKFILIRRPQLLKLKDRHGMDAMAYSCENQIQACIDVLLQHGAKINNGVGKERMTPLHFAASRGNFELCEFLIEKKAKINSKDKFKRSPLVMAVRNGHLRVASLLLSKGADWNQGDSSSNAPLHYAAAYGWQDCIDLLLKAGADINAQTSWKITPINIAMLKNHEGCVKKFLEHPEVDVNCKDEKGRTLLTLSLLNLREGTFDFIKFLLEKGADPNLPDAEQATSLHYLAKYQSSQGIHIYPHQPVEQQEQMRAQIKRKLEIQLEIADLLIQKGASLTLRDSEKRTPFSICLANHNEDLLKKLLQGVTVNNDPDIFHQMKNFILNTKYQQILREVIENETPKVESINILDDIGMTPFLAYIEKFCTSFEEVRSNIFKILVSDQGKKKDFDIKQITNEKLFDEQYLQMFNPTGYNQRNRKMGAKKTKSYSDENIDKDTEEEQKDTQDDTIENTESKVKSILDDQVIKPFIELLQYLILKKTDPHAQVQKLKRFRVLEEIRRLQLEGVQNDQIAEQVSQLQKNEERIKKREEVLKERESRKFNPRRAKKASSRAIHNAPSVTETDLQKSKDNKKEIEYDHHKGLQNAFHLAVKCPHQNLIQFLEKYKINADAEDHLKTTPLNLLSSSASNRYVDPDFQFLIQKLISLKVRIDFPDIKGRTPFLNFYGCSSFPQAEKLLGLGANVNQMDSYGLYALKYAMIRRNGDEIQKLVTTYRGNINQIDGKGRNLLHHAINMSSSTADATFDIEQVLIDLGININLRDHRKRTPLHYAFVKMKKWNDTFQIDPIETVSSLCGCKGLEIDVSDQWLKTPLHYASQRGASICAMYLQKRGADLESIDIYGNTALGVGIISKHFNYGIILIQKNADVTKLVHHVDPKKAELIFKQDQAKKDHEMGDNAEMTVSEGESESDDDNLKAKHRKIFDKNPNKNQFYGSEDDSDDESDEQEDSEDNYEQNVFNQQNAFGFNVFNNQIRQLKPQKSAAFGLFGQNNNQIAQPAVQEKVEYHEPRSMFRLSINFGQLGLAYLMLDQGYNLMKAMQDALDEKKFQLVLTFLGKNPDDQIIRQKNDKSQNLFHILSQNASSCRVEHLKKIYNALRLRGVNCLEQDGYGRTALHYAVESRNRDLVLMLLEEGADPAILDMFGYSPLIMYLKGKNIKNIIIYNQRNGDFDIILKSLIERGANVNQKYTENTLKSIYFQEVEYETSPIINYVRQHLEDDASMAADQQEKFINGFVGLVLCGSRFDILDSDNCDVLIPTIRHNHTELFNLIIAKSKKSFLLVDNQDVQGKSAIHHIVNPRNFGSYENVYMIEELFKLNYQLHLQDSQGKEPFVYALQQKSGKLRSKIAQLTKKNHFNNGIQRKLSGIAINEWQQVQVQAEDDSDLFMKEAQEKEDRELQKSGEQKVKELVPVDQTGRFEKSYRVLCENNKPWDVYLTKVDLKNGLYGDYVFYKIQLLYDQVRDLYVVFTRYGRIGEDGMNQRTPFNKVDDAKKEFCTIFKSKTSNEFQIEDLSHFQKQNKKYNLAKVTYSAVQHKDYLAPFDFEKCAKSQLDKCTRLLLEEVANITMYQRAMSQMGIDTSILPLSNINKQTVIHAMDLLKQLSVLIQEDQDMQKKGIKDIDYDLFTQGKDKIVELSSKYYELIPLSRYKEKAAPPISYPHQIQQAFSELECLVNIEHASKILLGALYRQQEMHPVDYVYAALNVIIQYVDSLSEEHKTIQQYVQNTNEGSIDFNTHKLRVFKVHRKGESEDISNFDDVPHHRLLFHGSQLFNFLGILSQGLRIAPPEAPATGYMFGKGIYFADAFCKSINYAQKSFRSQQESNLLLLCQVVLGKQKKLWQPEYVENLPSNFQSVHGVGRTGPDYKKVLTLENGIELPFGKMTEYKDFDPELANIAPQQPTIFGGFGGRAAAGPILQHNEFIVYNQSQVKIRYLLQIVQKSKEELSSQI